MNVEIIANHKNMIVKKKTDKHTGEMYEELVMQVELKKDLPDGQFEYENYNIPVDISLKKHYIDKKIGETIKVPCNIYASAINANYATLVIGKEK